MNNMNFVSGKKASEILGVHQRTLYLWEKEGKIETIRSKGGKRFYNINKYMEEKGIKCIEISKKEIKCTKIEDLDKINERIRINYARVSSIGQKNDLERQKNLLMEKYPKNILIEDIGSGIKLTKRGILKIIDLGIKGKIEEIVVVHKDRLARFGYDLIEYIIKTYSNGKITIINEKEEVEPEEEMVKDVLQIMNVFVAKMNGRRKYKKNKE